MYYYVYLFLKRNIFLAFSNTIILTFTLHNVSLFIELTIYINMHFPNLANEKYTW